MKAGHDQLARTGGRPALVMAHGVGGTVDSGLHRFAEVLCGVGVDVLAFDYRGFGRSGGRPRQSVSMRDQIDDYHAAVAAARRLPGVDASRVGLWGVSLAGGHVLSVAAQRPDIAGVIALTPLVDGWAAVVLALRHRAVSSVARCTLAGARSRISTSRGGQPVSIPIVAPPGHDAAINLGDAHQRYVSLAGRPGAIRSTPPLVLSCCVTDPPVRRRASGARCWCRSVTATAVHRRGPARQRRPRPARRSADTTLTISTCGPAERFSTR